jgi:AcrR family transcriptional regulator
MEMKKKTETKRQAILDIAAEVFREMGFERASMSEICRRVGGSRATVYNYFPSKETLFFEVMHQANEAEFMAIHQVLDHATEDISDALRHFGEGLLKLIYSPNVMATRRLVISSFGNGELGRVCFELGPQRSLKEVAEFLSAAMEKGKLRQCDPHIATQHLRGLLESELIDGFAFQMTIDTSSKRIKEIVARAVSVFMAAYDGRMDITASR